MKIGEIMLLPLSAFLEGQHSYLVLKEKNIEVRKWLTQHKVKT